MRPKAIALLAREAGLDKKAEDPVILDLGKLTSVAKYFVIFHGNSDPHVKAIAENVYMVLKKNGCPIYHQEGMAEGLWILLDFGAVIVHVFYRETREFYGLERLWGDAARL